MRVYNVDSLFLVSYTNTACPKRLHSDYIINVFQSYVAGKRLVSSRHCPSHSQDGALSPKFIHESGPNFTALCHWWAVLRNGKVPELVKMTPSLSRLVWLTKPNKPVKTWVHCAIQLLKPQKWGNTFLCNFSDFSSRMWGKIVEGSKVKLCTVERSVLFLNFEINTSVA